MKMIFKMPHTRCLEQERKSTTERIAEIVLQDMFPDSYSGAGPYLALQGELLDPYSRARLCGTQTLFNLKGVLVPSRAGC